MNSKNLLQQNPPRQSTQHPRSRAIAANDFQYATTDSQAVRRDGFVMHSLVMARGGQLVEIDQVSVGDYILARCEATGENAYRRVTRKHVHRSRGWSDQFRLALCRIDIASPTGAKDALEVTPYQPLWVAGQGWTPACEIRAGQVLEICDPVGLANEDRPAGQTVEDVILAGDRWHAEVIAVGGSSGTFAVYDLEVDEYHSYFVGPFGVCVRDAATPTI